MLKLSINLFVLYLSISLFNVFSQNNANLEFNLDSLSIGDSVIIKAKLPSCGEFGQHMEKITVIRSANSYKASLLREKPLFTERQPKTIPLTPEFKTSFPPIAVNKSQQDQINVFFKEFKNYKIDESKGLVNALSSFLIKLPNNKIYWIEDYTLEWDMFTPLKNTLFNLSDDSYKRK